MMAQIIKKRNGKNTWANMEYSGLPPISIINSYKVWRDILGKDSFKDVQLKLNNDGYCTDCGGRGEINIKGHGVVRCICDLVDYEKDLWHIKKQLESISEPKSFEDFSSWGDMTNKKNISASIETVLKWMENLDRWLLIQGINGCGKSHILQSINTVMSPWTLYLSMTDLENLYFSSLGDDSEIALHHLVTRVSRFPILLLDDVGADYGKTFSVSVTRKIIDTRYRMYHEFLTVVTTNQTDTDLRMWDKRIGDRLLDVKNENLKMLVNDYRNNKSREK